MFNEDEFDLIPCQKHKWIIQSVNYQPLSVHVTCVECYTRGFVKDKLGQAFLPTELITADVIVYLT